MKVLLMGDEAPVLRLLRHVLNSFEEVEVIGEFSDSSKGLQAIKELQPDVCFLDIEMPRVNGLAIASELMALQTQVVFVTAYEHYAIEAFKVNAVDYILKPITKEEIGRVLKKLKPKEIQNKPLRVQGELSASYMGEFSVAYKGAILDWPTEKVADLCAYFLYHKGTKIDKWTLCDIFWPNLLPEKAKHNLYNAIYLLKKLFDSHGIHYTITNRHGYYEFMIEDIVIDFEKMDELLEDNSNGNKRSIENLEEIERLYVDEFMVRKDYIWCQSIRMHYEHAYSQSLDQLLECYIQESLKDKALLLGRKILQRYPEKEKIAVLLMPIYRVQGIAALQKFYNDYSSYLMEELQLSLSENTESYYQQIVAQMKLTL